MNRLNVSRPTAHSRIKQLDNLGIVEQTELKVQGGETRTIEPRSELRWPADLVYPEF
jgi:predicted transcriptional regulator